MKLLCCLCVFDCLICVFYLNISLWSIICLYICECDYVNYVNVYMQHSCNYIFHILLELEVTSSNKVVIMAHISLLQAFEIVSCFC